MLDGVDGLAAGHVLVVIGSLAAVQLLNHGTLVQPLWLSVLAAVVFAFWLVNMSLTPLKRVFLGDAGSLLSGICGVLATGLLLPGANRSGGASGSALVCSTSDHGYRAGDLPPDRPRQVPV